MSGNGRWLSRFGSTLGAALDGLAKLFNRAANALGNILLLVMFLLLLLVGSDAIFQAYRDLHCANAKIEQSLTEVRVHLENLYTTGTGSDQLTPEAEAFVRCLEAGAKDRLDSNTISFLFVIFSLCLVSAGVYLLNRARQNLSVAEEKVALIGPFVANGPVASAIMGYSLAAYQTTWLLRTTTNEEAKLSYITQARDYIEALLKPYLRRAADDERGIEPVHHSLFIDLITNIKSNLEHLEDRESVSSLISNCEECERLLKESSFVENYRKQLRKFLDKPKDWME